MTANCNINHETFLFLTHSIELLLHDHCVDKKIKNKHHEVALEDELTSKSEIHFGIDFFLLLLLMVIGISMSNNINECPFSL